MPKTETVDKVTPGSVTEIRNAIREIDERRRDPSLEPKEREMLELSAVTLRKAERVASAALQKEVTAEMADAVKDLKKQSSLIRARVTRMSKVPKTLDRIESVIGGVVSVLKEISRWSFCLAFIVLMVSSCAVLTQSQVKMASNLSSSADTATVSPSVIFDKLGEVRKERGLLYASTLSSSQAHWEEVVSLSEDWLKNDRQIQKTESYVKALNSYSRAVGSLANTARWKKYGTELRGIGRNVDSVFHHVNKLGWIEDGITTGFAKLSGRYLGILTESYMKCRQAKAVKELVTEADTLVSECVSSLVEILKSASMKNMIENEKTGLKDDYRAFLDAAALSGDFMLLCVQGDRVYFDCYQSLENASEVRTKCISALQSYKRAHHKLAVNFKQRSNTSSEELVQDIYDDIAELNLISSQLAKLIR